MPSEPIFLGNNLQAGQDRIAGASPQAINVVTDERGSVRRRPVITSYSGAPSTTINSAGVQGLYVTEAGVLFAVAGTAPTRHIYRVVAGGAVDMTVAGGTAVGGYGRPTFAETEALLVIAAGGIIQKVDLSTYLSSALGGTPPEATHVIANASRLLANDPTVDPTKVRYSDIATSTVITGHEVWTFAGVGVSGFFTAESRPDPVVALHENTNEVYLFGSSTVQVWQPDGALVYAPVSARELGCSAPHSIVKVDQEFCWLDHRRRFVVSNGRTYEVISAPIQQVLDDMAAVSDCFGYRVHLGPVDCFVWTFPTDGRTFSYQKGVGWGNWQGFSTTANNWTQFPVTAHCHNRADNGNIVGLSTGVVGELQLGVTDGGLEGAVPSSVTTGFLDRGTSARKWCRQVVISCKRGLTSSTTGPVGFLQFADVPDQWTAPMALDFGASHDKQAEIVLHGLGEYRRRAWRFTFSPTVDLQVSRVTEDYTVLGS